MATLIGALRVVLGMDSAAFEEGLSAAEKKLNKFGKNMGKLGSDLMGLGAKLSLGLTAPIAAFGVSTVKVAGDFESSMNRVEAASGATTQQLSDMRDLALKLGADTSKSASEAADAMEMLAKNGLNAEQILGGAADAALKLAEASGAEMSSAADVTTDVMMSFNKTAKDMGGLVDGITGVLLQSKFGFDDYRLAIGQAGGVAGQLGVEFEDFNAAIAATSSSFASGSDAGTSFKTFLLSLPGKSDSAAAEIKRLGLEFYDAQGNMKSMSAVAEELQTKLSGLNEQQLSQSMNTIFGTDAMRTAIGLMKQGGEGLDALKAKMEEASAADQAAARMKGFNGEIEKLSGAFETLQIKIADSGLLSMVTEFVKVLGTFVDTLAELDPAILSWGVTIAGIVAIVGPVTIAIGGVVSAIGGIATILASVGPAIIAFVASTGPIGLIIAGLAALGVAIYTNWDKIKEFGTYMMGEATQIWTGFTQQMDQVIANCQRVWAELVIMKDNAIAALKGLYDGAVEYLGQKLDAVWNNTIGKIQEVSNWFYKLYDDTVGHSYIPDMVDEIGQHMLRLDENMVKPAGDAATKTSGEFQSLGETMGQAFSGIGGSIAEVIKGTKSLSEALGEVLLKLGDSLFQSGMQAIFGGGAGGGGGGFGSIISDLIGGLIGFQNGGSVQVGGAGGIDSQLVAFRASPNERVSITKPGQDMGGGAGSMRVEFVPTVDGSGNLGAYVKRIAQTESKGASAAAVRGYDKALPTRLQTINAKPRFR